MKISELHIYPVKSLKGISLDSSELLVSGFRFDRQWMLVKPDGTFLTQRECPQMSLVETAIDNGELVVSTFGMDDLRIKPANSATQARMDTDVWGDGISALVYDDVTNQWFSDAIGEPCKLVGFPVGEDRQCDPDFAQQGDHTYFADGFPLLLVSQESLDDLNSRLEHPVGMERFRPNIVVTGCEPFAEDNWKKIEIGDAGLTVVKPCARCSVPTVDPQRGVLAGPEPIHTLSSYRSRDGEVFFGMNLVPQSESELHVGDDVRIPN